jgi:predicted nucleic acid-binding protein
MNEELSEPIPQGNLGYSIITAIELLSFSGLDKEEERIIQSSLKSLEQIILTASIAEKTIQLRRQYHLKVPDAIVCATAWEGECILLTNDKQLANIKEIQVISLKTKN